MEALINKAKELGIENAESLTEKQLKSQIYAKEKEIKERAELISQCEALDIDTSEFDAYSNQEIAEALESYKVGRSNESKIALICEHLGIADLEVATIEEITKAFDGLKLPNQPTDEVADVKGKFESVFEVLGSQYQFTKKAPASFRFLDIVKTQEEWVKDEDALEIMIAGGLSYIKKI